jgi:type IX secretion system PorP/SprF family membrane protein
MGYYNPAYAGKTGELNAQALYRLQWLGVKNAPKSTFIAADMPWMYGKKELGIGIVLFSDQAGSLEKDMYTSLQLAYKKKLGKGKISFGLQAGLLTKTFNGDEVYIPEGSDDHEQTDEALTTSKGDAMGLDLNAGLFYYTDKYYIGLAATHLLEPNLKIDENMERKVERGFNLTAGYNIQTKNPLFELQPSAFVQTNLQMTYIDMTARAVYNKKYNGGLGVRMDDYGRVNAVILYLGANIGNFRIGYAYDFPTSAISRVSTGSQELMATYRLKLEKKKGKRNKHKSVRFL